MSSNNLIIITLFLSFLEVAYPHVFGYYYRYVNIPIKVTRKKIYRVEKVGENFFCQIAKWSIFPQKAYYPTALRVLYLKNDKKIISIPLFCTVNIFSVMVQFMFLPIVSLLIFLYYLFLLRRSYVSITDKYDW